MLELSRKEHGGALRISPAMAAGVTDRRWSIEDLLAPWEVYEQRAEEAA